MNQTETLSQINGKRQLMKKNISALADKKKLFQQKSIKLAARKKLHTFFSETLSLFQTKSVKGFFVTVKCTYHAL